MPTHRTCPASPALVAILLAWPLAAEEKPKGLSLSLRAVPRVAAAPVSVLFTAEVEGGADADVHCASLQWEWGDGSKGSTEGECPDYAAETKVERLFEAEHEYRKKGRPQVRLRLVKEGKTLATATVDLMVGAPKGKTTFEIEQR